MISNLTVKINTGLKESYNKMIESLITAELSCPSCKAKGQMKAHGKYARHTVTLHDGVIVHEILEIVRLKCKSCNKTHALLPDFIIPNFTFGIKLVLKCLEKYFNKQKINEICEKFNISFQLLYRWIKRLQDHKTQMMLLFHSGKETLCMLLKKILSLGLSRFLNEYFYEFKYCFMQIINST